MFSPSGRLFRIDQVPDNFRELFIMSGYRYPRSSAKQCIQSMFQPTNETVNIWTHLLPTLYFWHLTFQLWHEFDIYNDAYMYPMMCFMISVCIFPSASCAAHIFNTMSDHARHICFFIDYCAINWYSVGGAVAFKAYVFPKALIGTVFDTYYLPIAAVNSVVSTAISCQTRFMTNGSTKKVLRMVAFAFPYAHDVVPLLYRTLFCAGDECDEAGIWLHKRQFVFAFGATFLYGSHLPERWYPGQFDILGHSHQIFHVLCVLATHDQISAVIRDLTERRAYLESHVDIPSYQGIALMATVGAIILATLLFYIQKLNKVIPVAAGTPFACRAAAAADDVSGTKARDDDQAASGDGDASGKHAPTSHKLYTTIPPDQGSAGYAGRRRPTRGSHIEEVGDNQINGETRDAPICTNL